MEDGKDIGIGGEEEIDVFSPDFNPNNPNMSSRMQPVEEEVVTTSTQPETRSMGIDAPPNPSPPSMENLLSRMEQEMQQTP
jgi:hypothetical protein